MALKVADLVRAMEAIAPTRYAAPWDNVGLLVGNGDDDVSRVLLTIDCTRQVVDEALRERCDAIVAYHPPIFEAQKRWTAGSIAYELARAGLAVYSPHTAFDAAEGGTNDVLADVLGLTERAPLRPVDPSEAEFKLVTFVPAAQIERVSGALFAAGAGRIGNYSSCSFRAAGVGTFFGEAGSDPAIGSAGRLEEVSELRFETVVAASRLHAVVRALRQSHPYEEPAFDLVPLAAPPSGHGFGRIGRVPPARARVHVERVKRALGVAHVLVAGDLDREISRAAVCAGSGGELAIDAVAAGAQLFLTGELRHHDTLRAVAAGTVVICTLHSVSERSALTVLERRLATSLPAVPILRSRVDADPFSIV